MGKIYNMYGRWHEYTKIRWLNNKNNNNGPLYMGFDAK